MLRTYPGRKAANKIFRGEQIAQVNRKFGPPNRVVFPSSAAMNVAEEVVVNRARSLSVGFDKRLQSCDGEKRFEYVVKCRHPTLEFFDDVRRLPAIALHPFEHPASDFFLACHGRKVGEG